MIKAAAMVVGGLCAAAAGQNAQVQYTWEWSEVLAGTAIPSSATPGVIDPTEGVRLTLHALMVPGVGQAVSYAPGPGPGVGTVYNWGANDTVVRGSTGTDGVFALPTAAGGFSSINFEMLSPSSVFLTVFNEWFQSQPTSLGSNPVHGLISFTWTPTNYSQRTVSFMSEDPISLGASNLMIVKYGTGPTGEPLLTATSAIANHGPGTGGIPIVPGPGVAVVIGLGMMMVGRRRGQMSKLANLQMGK